MPSFSFNCPQCGKSYEKVKSAMEGRKVSCTCGKVFRLGPKTDQQKTEGVARKARKRAARKNRPRRSDPQNWSASSPVSDTPVHPDSSQPFTTTPMGNANSVFEALSVDELMPPLEAEQESLVRELPAELFDESLMQNQDREAAPSVSGSRLATPSSFAKKPIRKQKIKRVKPREPMGGAIWTICFAFPASLVQFFVASSFMSNSANRYFEALALISKLVGWLGVVFAVLILIAGILAVAEVVKGERSGTATKVAGIGGVVMIVANALFCSLSLLGLATGGSRGGAGAVGYLFLSFVLISVVPITAAITGFVRNQPT